MFEPGFSKASSDYAVKVVVPVLDYKRNKVETHQNHITVEDEQGTLNDFLLVKALGIGASAKIYKTYSHKSLGHNRGGSLGNTTVSSLIGSNKSFSGQSRSLKISPLKPLAVKRIIADDFEGYEEEFRQLLQREQRALEELSNQPLSKRLYLTNYLGYFYHEARDEHWLAMEYCDGGSVYDLTRLPTPIRIEQICAISAGLMRGLEVIHNKGFIHGDIKSANLLLASPGLVKICDFGLCSKLKGVENPDLHALGTLDYEAPEQLLKSLAIDHRYPNPERYRYDTGIDVWAAGILTLELMLGRTPLGNLRRANEDEFSFFIANMCRATKSINQGSALGQLFYPPKYHKDIMEDFLNDLPRRPIITSDLDLLCHRFPVLSANRTHLVHMLSRPHMFNKVPNPRREVPRPKVHKLFMLNKVFDYVAMCLFIDYKQRPSSTEMQEHPFIRAASRELASLEQHFGAIMEMNDSFKHRKAIHSKYKCSLTLREVQKLLTDKTLRRKEKLFREVNI